MLKKGTVLQIHENEAVLGFEDGSLFHCPLASFNYYPVIGDSVLIYGDLDGEHVVTRSGSGPGNANIFHNHGPRPYDVANVNSLLPINKGVYLLAAFLGGIFGVHKFITGRVAQGIVYFFLSFVFGVSFILACIEGFMALGQPTDEYGRFYPRSLFDF